MGSYNYVDHLGLKDVCRICLDPCCGKYKLAIAAPQLPQALLFQRLVPAGADTGGFGGNLGISYLKAKLLSCDAVSVG